MRLRTQILIASYLAASLSAAATAAPQNSSRTDARRGVSDPAVWFRISLEPPESLKGTSPLEYLNTVPNGTAEVQVPEPVKNLRRSDS